MYCKVAVIVLYKTDFMCLYFAIWQKPVRQRARCCGTKTGSDIIARPLLPYNSQAFGTPHVV